MSSVATISAGGAIIGGVMSNNASKDAASSAQSGNQSAMVQQQANLKLLMDMLKPYRQAGVAGLGGQRDLIGLNGQAAQGTAIDNLSSSPQFQGLVKSGEDALLQNASATGGLRGGNTSAALAQFRPQMLQQLIDTQYSRLGGLASNGQNAAGTSGGFSQNATNNISNLYQNQGQIGAQSAIAQGTNMQNMFGGIAGAVGQYQGQQQNQALIDALNGKGGGL